MVQHGRQAMCLQDIDTSTPAEAMRRKASRLGDVQAFQHVDDELHQLSRRLHKELARRPNLRKYLDPRMGAQERVSHTCTPSALGLQLGFAFPANWSKHYPAIGAFETLRGRLSYQF